MDYVTVWASDRERLADVTMAELPHPVTKVGVLPAVMNSAPRSHGGRIPAE